MPRVPITFFFQDDSKAQGRLRSGPVGPSLLDSVASILLYYRHWSEFGGRTWRFSEICVLEERAGPGEYGK